MSTLFVDSVAGQGGGTETNLMDGLAKAALKFDGIAGTVAAFAHNIASLTDNGAGDTSVNFTNNFADADYTCHGTCVQADNSQAGNLIDQFSSHTFTTSSVEQDTFNTANNTLADMAHASSTMAGDLA